MHLLVHKAPAGLATVREGKPCYCEPLCMSSRSLMLAVVVSSLGVHAYTQLGPAEAGASNPTR